MQQKESVVEDDLVCVVRRVEERAEPPFESFNAIDICVEFCVDKSLGVDRKELHFLI